MSLRLSLVALAAALMPLVPGAASAADPGRWTAAPATPLPSLNWFQGMGSDPQGRLFFDGVSTGLYRADGTLAQTAGVANAISPAAADEGYNHVGDLAWDAAEGGRVLLPLECYAPFATPSTNTCGTGALSVNDPETLAPRYHVELGAPLTKAMWVAVAQDGHEIYTSQGRDLLVYDGGDVALANAAPGGPALTPLRTLAGALPSSSITGGVVWRGRLYVVQGDTGASRPFRLWSVDPATGTSELEAEPAVRGESEGLDATRLHDGVLHWMVQPLGQPQPTYSSGVLLNLRPADGPNAALALTRSGPARWTLSARNAGTQPTSGPLVVRLAGDATLAPLTVAGAGWTCDGPGGAVACTRTAALAAGADAPLAVTARMPGPGTHTLRAAATTENDFVGSDDVASDTLDVPGAPAPVAPAAAPPAGVLAAPAAPAASKPAPGRVRATRSARIRVGRTTVALALTGRTAKLTVRGGRLRTDGVTWLLDGRRTRIDRRPPYTCVVGRLKPGAHRLRAVFTPAGSRRSRRVELRFAG